MCTQTFFQMCVTIRSRHNMQTLTLTMQIKKTLLTQHCDQGSLVSTGWDVNPAALYH